VQVGSGATLIEIDTSSPTVPGGLYVNGVTSAAFTLGWSASSDNVGVSGYRLDVSTSADFLVFASGYNNLDVGDVLTKVIVGLAESATYYARLRAYDAVGNISSDSAVLSTLTVTGPDISAPTAPTGLYAGGVSSAALTLGWSASADNVGVTGYRLDVSTSAGFAVFVAGYNNQDLGNVLTKTITGLSEALPYYARLRAYDAAGNISSYSAELSTVTASGPDISSPTAPGGLYAGSISSAVFTLGWSAGTDNVGVAGYRLEVSTSAGFAGFVDGYDNQDVGSVLTKSVTGLSGSTTYYARLRAYDAAGNISSYSAALSTVTASGPDISSPTAPGGLYASGVSSAVFALGWAAAADNVGATGYRLDVSTSAGFAVFVAGYNDRDLGNVLTASVTGLSDSATYYARLRAYDAAGNTSADSSVLSTTTTSGPDVLAPTPPAGLYAGAVSSAAFTLGWSASSDNVGVTGYRLDVSTSAGFGVFVAGYNNQDVGNVLDKSITGLSENATYYARLRGLRRGRKYFRLRRRAFDRNAERSRRHSAGRAGRVVRQRGKQLGVRPGLVRGHRQRGSNRLPAGCLYQRGFRGIRGGLQ
jgi:chitodextrinase